MIDVITIVIALAFLAILLKPVLGGGNEIDDAFSGMSLLVLAFGIAIYFYNIDIFPEGGSLGFLHVIEVGLVYAIALIDVFFKTALGMPLSTQLLFGVIFPCAIIYRVAKSMLNFVAILSHATVALVSGCCAFIMFVSVTYGKVNIVTWFFTAIDELLSFFAGLFPGLFANKLAGLSFSVFAAGVVIIAFGVFFETVAVVLTSEILRNA